MQQLYYIKILCLGAKASKYSQSKKKKVEWNDQQKSSIMCLCDWQVADYTRDKTWRKIVVELLNFFFFAITRANPLTRKSVELTRILDNLPLDATDHLQLRAWRHTMTIAFELIIIREERKHNKRNFWVTKLPKREKCWKTRRHPRGCHYDRLGLLRNNN